MALKPTGGNAKNDETTDKPSAEDEILMREIDEAVRKDDLEQFGKRYGVTVIGGIVGILAILGGYMLWDSQVEAGLEAESETLVSAIDQLNAGNVSQAAGVGEELTSSSTAGVRASGLFLEAVAALQDGKTEEAAQAFAQVADDQDVPAALRDLALIREVAADFDNREPAAIIERLQPLTVPGNPFFGTAGELTALAHLEAGDNEAAGTLFSEIANADGVPDSLRSRARQMAGLLGVDAIDDVRQLLEDQGIESDDDGSQGAGSAAIAQ